MNSIRPQLPETHLNFPCVAVPQGPRVTLYLGALRFDQLWPLCTVSPRQPRQDDPLYSSEPRPIQQSPQREAKDHRLQEIADFVEERLLPNKKQRKEAIFPGSIILGLLTDVENEEAPSEIPSPAAAMIRNPIGESLEVWLPKIPQALFIIDGQHRLKGLRHLEERIEEEKQQLIQLGLRITTEQSERLKECIGLLADLSSLKVPISLLVDFDLSEQAMVFATVNFKQKTVSRSFYYDIFGAFESEQVTPISFTHDLVLHLNNSEKSPLKDMIKLLGTGPGLVSQAFLVARLALMVDPGCPKAVFRDYVLRRQVSDMEASRQLAGIIRAYFGAIRSELAYAWPQRYEGRYSAYHYQFILCKSMVMSGLLAILGDIYRLALLDFAFGSESQVAVAEIYSESFLRKFLLKFDPEGRENFTNSAFARGKPWSIGGSAVVEKRIYEEMRKWVFSAYIEIVTDGSSQYLAVLKRFNGPRRAAALIETHPEIEAIEFWTRTERIWSQLIGQTTS